VARSWEGEVIAAKAGCSSAIHNSFTAELHSMVEAFNMAAELGVIRAEFETDAQLLAMALNSNTPDYSSEAVIIQDLKFQMSTWFSSCKVKFSRRNTNQVAHSLAKFGMNCNVDSVRCWEYQVPACARVAALGDLTQTVS
jgi:ribonuclease HI